MIGTLPKVLTGDLDAYVDWQNGSDVTGDGTLGNPFQTIDGCWNKLGALYIASPIYKIRIHLIRPGDHVGCEFAAYGGIVEVHGGVGTGAEATKNAYKIVSRQNASPPGNPYSICVTSNGMTSLTFYGVNFVMRGYPEGTGVNMIGLSVGTGFCAFIDCSFTIDHDNPATMPIWSKLSSIVGFHGINDFFTNSFRVSNYVFCAGGDFSSLSGAPSTLRFHPGTITSSGFRATDVARFSIPGCTIIHQGGGATGIRYRVENNAVMSVFGQTPPGDAPGSFASGGIYNP